MTETAKDSVDYHLQSMRTAFVRQWAGGVEAGRSILMQIAVGALLGLGMSEDQIIAAYREKFPK